MKKIVLFTGDGHLRHCHVILFNFIVFYFFLFAGLIYVQDFAFSSTEAANGASAVKSQYFLDERLSPASHSLLAQTLPHTPSFQPEPGSSDHERIEADVSTRTIAITSGYSGAEVLVFGAIENSQQPSPESGFYDVVVTVEGKTTPLTLRKKDRLGGVWVNTHSLKFNSVPTFYTLAATRPIEEFINQNTQEELGLGLNSIVMAASSPKQVLSSAELTDSKNAIVRVKQAQGLFQREDRGVVFTGRSLFRSTLHLPASVPVGLLKTRIFLFRGGKLLSSFQAEVMLEREGIERWLYAFAFERPFSYGFFTVFVALVTGLFGSALFHRRML